MTDPDGAGPLVRYDSLNRHGRRMTALAPPWRYHRPGGPGDGVRTLWPGLWMVDDAAVLWPEGAVLAGRDALVIEGLSLDPAYLRTRGGPGLRPVDGATARLTGTGEERHDGVWALLGGDTFDNYYHWVLDFVPRALALSRRVRLPPARILIKEPPPGFGTEILDALGIGLEARAPLDASRRHRFERLIVVTNFTEYGFIHPATWPALRDLAARLVPGTRSRRDRRLFVSRASASRRRLVNEDEIAAVAAGFGFETVHPERLTLAEQIALFSEAELVAGPHGAGLTNLVWSDTAGLIELLPEAPGLNHYKMICQLLDRPYSPVAGECVGPAGDWPGAADFHVPAARMAEALEQVA